MIWARSTGNPLVAVTISCDLVTSTLSVEAVEFTTMNWLVEREALVSIPPKKPEQVRLSLTQGEMSLVTWLVLLIMPGAAIAVGVSVYLRRRR